MPEQVRQAGRCIPRSASVVEHHDHQLREPAFGTEIHMLPKFRQQKGSVLGGAESHVLLWMTLNLQQEGHMGLPVRRSCPPGHVGQPAQKRPGDELGR